MGESESNGRDEDHKEPPRPLSVRESVGGTPPRPVRSAGGPKPRGDSDRKVGRSEVEGDAPSRPTPVRQLMREAAGGGGKWTPPSRVFDHEGQEWVVTVVGQTVTGLPSDPGAPLMHLRFALAEDPDEHLRELLSVGRDLEPLYDEELRQLLDRSRPVDDS